ncbi:MAG: hypothetical protein GKR88_01520 [Flavobacteriaceae bacterium]|nr:MAG: hypothetical protein GKR88_01520 [Flavobacteriaceae bacterium]
MKKYILLALSASVFVCYLIHINFSSLKGIYVIDDNCTAVLRTSDKYTIGDTIYVEKTKSLLKNVSYDWYSVSKNPKNKGGLKKAIITHD